jgi:hypothetical protein
MYLRSCHGYFFFSQSLVKTLKNIRTGMPSLRTTLTNEIKENLSLLGDGCSLLTTG